MYPYLQIVLILLILFLLIRGIKKVFASTDNEENVVSYEDDSTPQYMSYDVLNPVISVVQEREEYIPATKSSIDDDIIGTKNSYLEEVENSAFVYEVFMLVYTSLSEMNQDESCKSDYPPKTFNTGTTEERLYKAQKTYKIECENIVFRKGIFGNESPKWFKILLVSVQNKNGLEKRVVLKSVNSSTIDQNY